MFSIGIPLLLALIWGVLMVFVWRSISRERRVTKSIIAIVGGVTCLMIFRVGYVLSSLIEEDMGAQLDLIYSSSAEPESKTEAQEPAIREITIHVTEAGSLELDGRPLDDASLEAELLKLAKKGPKLVVTVIADDPAPYQRVIDFLNLLAKAKIENVTFEAPGRK